MAQEKREHFRLHFTRNDAPTFAAGGKTFPVLEVSEKGLRIAILGPAGWKDLKKVRGVITFKSGATAAVSCEILRMTPAFVVLKVENEIPLSLIMAEHRRQIAASKS